MIRSDPRKRKPRTIRNRRNRDSNKEQETRLSGAELLSGKAKAEEQQEVTKQAINVADDF